MAPRTFWKGYLKLSLVTCPVAMVPAVSTSEKVRFHTLNQATGNRVRAHYVDPQTDAPVEDDDLVLGYEQADGGHVLFEDEELDEVALESTRTIDIQTFMPISDIAWIWYDQPHYLLPDDKVGAEAFEVIRAAMAETKTVGISRVVLYRRERAVMLVPHAKGMVLWTLRYGDEVRPPPELGAAAGKGDAPEPGLKTLLTRLIDARTKPWSADFVADPVQAGLLDLIARKQKGRKRAPKAAPPAPATASNVVDIMDALKRSLAAERGKKTRSS